jgi:hypothetical protein
MGKNPEQCANSEARKPNPICEIDATMQARIANKIGQPRLVEFGLIANAIDTHQLAVPLLFCGKRTKPSHFIHFSSIQQDTAKNIFPERHEPKEDS